MPKILNTPSPNFAPEKIPVEFLILHYTACTLERTLEIFLSPEKKLCAHFVIDLDGAIHDLGGFWNGEIRKGAHAGQSSWKEGDRLWEGFNAFSIGVEIVNLNGNLLDYPSAQYDALTELGRHLAGRFPALGDPNRVLGHEQIAGFRGKSDPGMKFDWARFFSSVYPGRPAPRRDSRLTPELWARFEAKHGKPDFSRMKAEDWSVLSSQLEAFAALSK